MKFLLQIHKAKSTSDHELTGSDKLYQRLKNCLHVQAKYKEAFRSLRDGLGGAQALQSFPSISSIQNSSDQNIQSTSKLGGGGKLGRRSVLYSANDQTLTNVNHGILMSEEEVIFEHIDQFCLRVSAVIEQIKSLKQFQDLLKVSKGLKRPKKEDLGIAEEDEVTVQLTRSNQQQIEAELSDVDEVKSRENTDLFSASRAILETLVEESEEVAEEQLGHKKVKKNYFIEGREGTDLNREKSFDMRGQYESENKRLEKQVANSNRVMLESAQKLFSTEKRTEFETKNLLKTATQHLSSEDVRLMQKFYGNKIEGPSISSIVESYLLHMKKIVKSLSASQVMDLDDQSAST